MISRRAVAGLLAVLTLPLAACGDGLDRGDAPDSISVGVLAEDGKPRARSEWSPVLEDMEEAIGLEVRPFFGSNPTALVEAMRFRQADVGRFPSAAGLEAVRRAGGEVFARAAEPVEAEVEFETGAEAGAPAPIPAADGEPPPPPVPDDPMIWRKDLDPAVKEKLRQFFLTYGQGEGPRAERQRRNLRRLSIAGFGPADEAHLLPVREMEAMQALQRARDSGDPQNVEAAREALEDIRRDRLALQAKAGQPVAAP